MLVNGGTTRRSTATRWNLRHAKPQRTQHQHQHQQLQRRPLQPHRHHQPLRLLADYPLELVRKESRLYWLHLCRRYWSCLIHLDIRSRNNALSEERTTWKGGNMVPYRGQKGKTHIIILSQVEPATIGIFFLWYSIILFRIVYTRSRQAVGVILCMLEASKTRAAGWQELHVSDVQTFRHRSLLSLIVSKTQRPLFSINNPLIQ